MFVRRLGVDLDFLTPKNLDEALKMVGQNPNFRVLAGGTDLCVSMNSGQIRPQGLINIWGLDDLRGIREREGFVEIGALTTHTEIVGSSAVCRHLPALVEACKTVGARQIQNRGTIGGNVMNASPAGDTLPVLLAHDASVEVASEEGVRWIPFADFYLGYRKTAVREDEVIIRFKILKALPGEKSAFMKIGTRRAQAISKVMGCFRISFVVAGLRAGHNELSEVKSVAIAFGSVAPVPIRLGKAEKFLTGKKLTDDVVEKMRKMVVKEVRPIDDIRSSSVYRRHVCGVLITRFLFDLPGI